MPELTAEFVEREYNNRALVPEHAQHFARWAAQSAKVRSEQPCHLDLRYGPGPKETLDIFPSAAARGTVVFIHGGYWRALDKSDQAWIAPAFSAAGLSVAVLNYDLCPAVSIERIVDEQRQALAWLAANGHRYGAPSQRVALTGHSAGGHLVAMLYATDWPAWNVSPRSVVGGVSVSGVFDLKPMRLFAFNADFRLDAAAVERLSPLNHRPTIAAPLWLAVGALESSEFLRQSQLLWERWSGVRPAGSRGPMQVAGRNHFSVIEALADPSHSLYAITAGLFA